MKPAHSAIAAVLLVLTFASYWSVMKSMDRNQASTMALLQQIAGKLEDLPKKPDAGSPQVRRRVVLPNGKDSKVTPGGPARRVVMADSGEVPPETRALEYTEGSTVLEGWVAQPKFFDGKVPGVLVIPDATGVEDFSKGRAGELAKLGYVALVADIHGKGVRPTDPGALAAEAGKYLTDRKLFRQRLVAALEELKKQPNVDPGRLFAIGYSFGGTGVLELARAGADVKGIVSFHGGLDSPTPEDGKNIKARVLILHGEADPVAGELDLAAVTAELHEAKVDWKVIRYSGAEHSFTNPAAATDDTPGHAYSKSADEESWRAMETFLEETITKLSK